MSRDRDDDFIRAPEDGDEYKTKLSRKEQAAAQCRSFIGKFFLAIIAAGLIFVLVIQIIAMGH